MQIVYILSNLNQTAPNTVIVNIIKNLRNEVIVISLNKSSSNNYKEVLLGCNVCIIETKNIFEIARLCEDKIVHLNGYHPNIAGFFIRYLSHMQKMVATCHSNELSETKALNFQGLKLLKSKIKHAILPFLYNRCDEVVAVSCDVKEYLHTIGVKNVRVIYNGIEFIDTESITKKNTPIQLAQIGHIMPLKNQLFTLEVVAYLVKNGLDVHLGVFGGVREFAYELKLQAFIEANALAANVTFYGHLESQKLFHELQHYHFCMMPSLSEGLPLALLEAMSLKLIPIVSNCGGMKEAINILGCGLIIDLKQEDVFEHILAFMRESLVATLDCESSLKEIFSAQKMGQAYGELYENTHLS